MIIGGPKWKNFGRWQTACCFFSVLFFHWCSIRFWSENEYGLKGSKCKSWPSFAEREVVKTTVNNSKNRNIWCCAWTGSRSVLGWNLWKQIGAKDHPLADAFRLLLERSGGERFGSQKACQRHLKTECKTHLNFYAIVNNFGSPFGSLFCLRMGVPGQNFRFRSAFLLRWRFGGVQVPPQPRFWEDLGGSMSLFWAHFWCTKFLAWSMF